MTKARIQAGLILVTVAAALVLAFMGRTQDSMVCALIAGGCAVFMHLSQVERFRIGATGIEAVTRDLKSVRAELSELQDISAVLSKAIFTVAEGASRFGGMPQEHKDEVFREIAELFQRLDLSQKLRVAMSRAYSFYELDYERWVLKNIDVHHGFGTEVVSAASALYPKGIGAMVGPERLEQFLRAHFPSEDDRWERLRDYQHYLVNRIHRRPVEFGTVYRSE
jgi:hypothetical protein